jgi:predicted DNA-binding ribbon-helix-helix protein
MTCPDGPARAQQPGEPGHETSLLQSRLAALLKPQKRSITLGGTETSIELEREFWRVIDELAKVSGKKWRDVVRDALHVQPDQDLSRASWLRVWCVLQQRAALCQLRLKSKAAA